MLNGMRAATQSANYDVRNSGRQNLTTITLTYFTAILLVILSGNQSANAQCSIGGAGVMCAGSSAPLSGSPGGGTWNSANTSIATVNGSGMVTGVNAGTAVISYHQGSCWSTKVVTVNTAPNPIGGTKTVCTGSTITLTDGVGGGVWSYSTTHITAATSGANYLVTGATAGVASVTYTVGTGGNACAVNTNITVNATPAAITGAPFAPLCTNNSINMNDGTGGGVWTSSNTTVAMVTGGNHLTGGSAGTTTISYTVGSCAATTVVTVNNSPAAIGGPEAVCTGSNITLTDGTSGGTWSCTASIVSGATSSGNYIVTGVTAGATLVTYTTGTGINACSIYQPVTVNPTGSIIPAMPEVCVGATISLSNTAAPGGSWTSVFPASATINAGTGMVTGIGADTVTMVYTLPTGCYATVLVTVNPDPAITGPTTICVGSTETLTPSISGGTWSSGNTAIATAVNSGSDGIVTGIGQGSATVSYEITATGCGITTTIVDNTTPAITGSNAVCAGSTITLSDATQSGTWSSSDETIATVDAVYGVVTGMATTSQQTVSISYATGCGPTVTKIVTVNPLPTVSASAATAAFCMGGSTGLTASGATTYAWATGASLSATTGATVTATPTVTNTYTVVGTDGNGCQNTATVAVTVNALPNVGASAYAPDVCIGSSTGLTATGGSTGLTMTYVWSADPTLSGTTGAAVTATPSVTNTYSVVGTDANGCQSAATVSVTVNSLPAISASAGSGAVCAGGSTGLTVTGGVNYTWTYDPTLSSNTGASVTATPTVTNTYSVVGTDGNGCQNVAMVSVTVNSLPAISATASASVICLGSSTTINATGGVSYVWATDASLSATTGATVIVTPTATDDYTVTATDGNGCQNTASVKVGVNPIPDISGTESTCAGATISLTSSYTGGTWTSLGDAASIDAVYGVVTGVFYGTATINYTLYGCTGSAVVTVNNLPDAITGTTNICAGFTGTLSDDTSGGIWSSSNNTVATIDPVSGVVTGVASGTTNITYSTGCGSSAIAIVTVFAAPLIGGNNSVFAGGTDTLTVDTTGGSWSSSDTTIAKIDSNGVITGVDTGDVTISYSVTAAYGANIRMHVYPAYAVVSIPISGVHVLCMGSGPLTLSLSGSATGGVWTSSNPGVATVSATGSPTTEFVNPVSPGITMITYVVGGVTSQYPVYVMPACFCMTAASTISILPLGLTGTIASGFYSGNYVIYNNVTIPAGATVNLSNAVIEILPGVTITVAPGTATSPGGKLNIQGSHLYSCGSMWNGIILPNAATPAYSSGQLTLGVCCNTQPTLIEDAITAVAILNPKETAAFAPGGSINNLTLYSSGAIINRCNYGYYISNYTTDFAGTPLNVTQEIPSYPFVVENTVFTSRDFTGFDPFGFTTHWPYVWPTLNAGSGMTGALKLGYATPTIYDPPYNIDNVASAWVTASGTLSNYQHVTCNNTLPFWNAMTLKNVGTTIGSAAAARYDGVYIGSIPDANNSQLNLFDWAVNGIMDTNSNLVVRNSVFMHSPGNNNLWTGNGVYAIMNTPASSPSSLPPFYRVALYGDYGGTSVPVSGNQFYDNATCLYTNNMYEVLSRNALMTSKHLDQAPTAGCTGCYGTPQGMYGFNMSSFYYYLVQVDSNYIYNTTNGVNFIATTPSMGYTINQVGQVYVDSNTIGTVPPSPAGMPAPISPANQYMRQGIFLQEMVPTLNWVGGAMVNADYNILQYLYNGIYVTGWGLNSHPFQTANTNFITMNEYSTAFGAYYPGPYATQQTGIYFTGNEHSYILNNSVTTNPPAGAAGYANPTPKSYISATLPYGFPLMEAIRTIGLQDATVGCNYVNNINTGFYFGSSMSMNWVLNHMNKNAYGYVLGGIIGPQPTGYPLYTTGNMWMPDGGGFAWSSWPTIDPNFETYTIGTTSAGFSPMNVGTAMPYIDPCFNNGDPFLSTPATWYGGGTCPGGLGVSVDPPNPIVDAKACIAPAYYITPVYSIFMMVHAATNTLGYSDNIARQNWIAQFMTYETMKYDTTVADSTGTLDSFYAMANRGSRYQLIDNIAQMVATGEYQNAAQLLTTPLDQYINTDSDAATGAVLADGAGADEIVYNYFEYYRLLIKYTTDTLNSTDSAEVLSMANECPDIDGNVIFQWRTLYSSVYNDNRLFPDHGCSSSDTSNNNGRRAKIAAQNSNARFYQNYSILPNPNSGYFSIKQLYPDTNPVSVKVLNTVGQCIYSGAMTFAGEINNLNLQNTTPGLYLLQITDSKGALYNIKFAIE